MADYKKCAYDKKIDGLITKTRGIRASFNALFLMPEHDDFILVETDHDHVLHHFRRVLDHVEYDLTILKQNPASASRLYGAIEDVDSIDCINGLITLCANDGFAKVAEESALCVVSFDSSDGENTLGGAAAKKRHFSYQINHADRFCRESVELFKDYLGLLERMNSSDSTIESRLNPLCDTVLCEGCLFQMPKGRGRTKALERINARFEALDPFAGGRAFRYLNGEFYSAKLDSIRNVDEFYGYPAARSLFRQFFKEFSGGKSNPPLLISSLPGLGKTHFTIAHILAQEKLVLILPEPSDLEAGLEKLVRALGRRRNRRFVIFFDDIDTRNLNWYYFRTHVGGSFVLPENVAMVVASNHPFPANILSRGRGFTFPMFDEVKCQEMVLDYLKSYGMKSPGEELVSVITADYVEEFGQKIFEELSPRTLVRYLDRYNRDERKRKRTLDLSKEQVVAVPDSQVFMEVNIKLMQSLYGEQAVEEYRQSLVGE